MRVQTESPTAPLRLHCSGARLARSTLVGGLFVGPPAVIGTIWGEALMGTVAGGFGPDRASRDVAFSVLGVVSAVDPNGALLALGSNRRRALLAALLVNCENTLSVDQLIDMLWDGPAPRTAATMVHGAATGLRRTFEPGRPRDAAQLVVTRGGYALDADPRQVDAFRFEQLLSEGRQLVDASPPRAARILNDALALWWGPALGASLSLVSTTSRSPSAAGGTTSRAARSATAGSCSICPR